VPIPAEAGRLDYYKAFLMWGSIVYASHLWKGAMFSFFLEFFILCARPDQETWRRQLVGCYPNFWIYFFYKSHGPCSVTRPPDANSDMHMCNHGFQVWMVKGLWVCLFKGRNWQVPDRTSAPDSGPASFQRRRMAGAESVSSWRSGSAPGADDLA
jgi:hypothetical protein